MEVNSIDFIISNTGLPLFWVKFFLGLITSFVITFFSIPAIVRIARRKNLMDEPGSRSSHIRKIPNLGGIALFFSIGVTAPVFAYELFDLYKFLFASLVILLYIGVMDDIVIMRAHKKLIAQIVVSVFIVFGSDVRIEHLFGLFGLYELSYWVSAALTIVVFVALINAFNLIDGIDGLAGLFTVICCSIFGISFYRLGEYNYPLVVLCIVIIGAVLAFLYYNLSEKRNTKIFMGDTGSMILGFLLAFTAILFIDIFIEKKDVTIPIYHLQTAPVIAVAVLILPIVDTLNVMIVRLINRRSLFEADKNHIHHKMLSLGFSHRKSTLGIILYYLFIIAITYIFRHININLLLILVLALGFIGAYIPDIIIKIIKK